jgi:hypothetical protein
VVTLLYRYLQNLIIVVHEHVEHLDSTRRVVTEQHYGLPIGVLSFNLRRKLVHSDTEERRARFRQGSSEKVSKLEVGTGSISNR